MLQPLCIEQFYPSPAADAVVQQLLPIPEAPPLPEAPDPKTCSPQEYLEYYIFPVLLPGMTELLHQAKKEKCFERERTKFIACDFLTEWLYNHNPRRKDESFTEFFSIPFVHDWLKDHPRQPLPLSFLLSEEEASIIIQAFWRGYRVRCDREVQELRQWQKQLRDEKTIFQRVEEFWAKQEAKVTCLVDDGKAVAVVYPDFSKAFDAVSHGILLQKLAARGLDSFHPKRRPLKLLLKRMEGK